jgi:uncharacterized protein with von Willebrand factor type A (vWA) domain
MCLSLDDSNVEVAFDLTVMDDSGRARCSQIVSRVAAGSSTNTLDGLVKGIELMKSRDDPRAMASILLMTDGEADQGDAQILSAMSKAMEGLQNVSVYTFGFGSNAEAALLKSVSDVGKGMYYFVETPAKVYRMH